MLNVPILKFQTSLKFNYNQSHYFNLLRGIYLKLLLIPLIFQLYIILSIYVKRAHTIQVSQILELLYLFINHFYLRVLTY